MVTVRERVRIFTPELQLCTRTGARATIVPVRRRRESEGRDRDLVPSFSYNRCEPSHVVSHCAVNRAPTNSSQDPPVLGCCQQPTNSPASGASRRAGANGLCSGCERQRRPQHLAARPPHNQRRVLHHRSSALPTGDVHGTQGRANHVPEQA